MICTDCNKQIFGDSARYHQCVFVDAPPSHRKKSIGRREKQDRNGCANIAVSKSPKMIMKVFPHTELV